MTRHCRLIAALLMALAHPAARGESLTFDQPELAGISGFRSMWDLSVPLAAEGAVEFSDAKIKDQHGSALWHPSLRKDQPGPIAFDALQRSVLVRFPGAAEAIAAKLAAGAKIEKVELVLPHRDTELWPQWGRDRWDPATGGYNARRNWGVDTMYRAMQPNWHAVAWALRQPWSGADPALAPTYNAFIQGAGYWAHSGAQDTDADRFPMRLGPTEVSSYQPEGRMDVTAVVHDAAFGDTLGQRLRVLADHGFVVRKWETYDHRYFNGVYEWATATGGRAILINTPRLEVTFTKGVTEKVALPPAPDVPALAKSLAASGKGGSPQARLLTEAELLAFNDKLMLKPDWMPQWQHQRIMELRQITKKDANQAPLDQPMFFDLLLDGHTIYNMYGKFARPQKLPASAYERYQAWVDQVLSRQPRGWAGFEAAKEMSQWYTFAPALPQPAKDAIKTYWTAWLMPDQETAPGNLHKATDDTSGMLIHPMADQLAGKKGTADTVADTYYAKTGDWRGNKSFYRSGFNYTISTQNFNTTASSGAMLGSAIIDDGQRPLADGRSGFQSYPLQLWAWTKGSSQEHIDHYYFSVSLSGNKAVWDFGPTLYDRLMGRSVIAYNMEELLSAWHPNLRRFIAPSNRTSLEYVLFAAEGIQHILHTLSKRGALLDLSKEQVLPKGTALIGHDVTPPVIALQSMTQPWADASIANLVDDKPMPFLSQHDHDGAWRTAFFDTNFGLSSVDRFQPRIQIMGQWRRDPEVVDQTTDLGTLDVRFGFNQTQFVNSGSGFIFRTGNTYALQHRNKMLVLASPGPMWHNPNGVGFPGSGIKEQVRSLQSSIILFNLQPTPTWEIYADGIRVESLPVSLKPGQVITIKDGVTYLGFIPLESTDLGRDAAVTIEPGVTQTYGSSEIASALSINNYNLRRTDPLTDADDFDKIDAAYGGFAIEMHNASDWPDFAAFQKHMASVQTQQSFHPEGLEGVTNASGEQVKQLHRVVYTSGSDVLEAAAPTAGSGEETLGPLKFHRRVNGQSPYPAPGIQRDTTTTQTGVAGRLEKAGAVLTHRPKAPAMLFHEKISGTYRAMIPTPVGSWLHLDLPDGRRIRTDGRVNLFDLKVLGDGTIDIWHDLKPGLDIPADPFARAVVFEGFDAQPKVTLNGQPVTPRQLPGVSEQAWGILVNRHRDWPDDPTIRQGLQSPR